MKSDKTIPEIIGGLVGFIIGFAFKATLLVYVGSSILSYFGSPL